MVPETIMPLPNKNFLEPESRGNNTDASSEHSVSVDNPLGIDGYSTSLEREHIQQTPSASSPSQQLRKSEAEDSRGRNQNQYGFCCLQTAQPYRWLLLLLPLLFTGQTEKLPSSLPEKLARLSGELKKKGYFLTLN